MVVEKKSTRGIKKKHKRNDQVTKKYYLALRWSFQMKCVDCKPSFGVACVCVCVCVCVCCALQTSTRLFVVKAENDPLVTTRAQAHTRTHTHALGHKQNSCAGGPGH